MKNKLKLSAKFICSKAFFLSYLVTKVVTHSCVVARWRHDAVALTKAESTLVNRTDETTA